MRRAAAWDGAAPLFESARHGYPPSPDEVRELVAYLRDVRGERRDDPFEVVVGGATEPARAADVIGPLRDAGATWWDERLRQDVDEFDKLAPVLRRVEAGPPQL
jgi:hypothetical protein